MVQPKRGRSGVGMCFLVVLAAGCGKCATCRQPAQQQAAQPAVEQTAASPPLTTDIVLPPWKADAALEKKLGSYQAVAGYEIRPLKDYKKKEISEPGPLNIQVHWVGKPRADKSRPQLTVLLLCRCAFFGETL